LKDHTPVIDTHNAGTAGVSAILHHVAQLSSRFAHSPPSTTPAQIIDVPTQPALVVATLRLLLALELAHWPSGPTPVAGTPPFTKNALAAWLFPLSGVPPLPKRSYIWFPLTMGWT